MQFVKNIGHKVDRVSFHDGPLPTPVIADLLAVLPECSFYRRLDFPEISGLFRIHFRTPVHYQTNPRPTTAA